MFVFQGEPFVGVICFTVFVNLILMREQSLIREIYFLSGVERELSKEERSLESAGAIAVWSK